MKIKVDNTKCTGCGKCVDVCRFGAIAIKDGKAKINEKGCRMCGICIRVCPAKALDF